MRWCEEAGWGHYSLVKLFHYNDPQRKVPGFPYTRDVEFCKRKTHVHTNILKSRPG